MALVLLLLISLASAAQDVIVPPLAGAVARGTRTISGPLELKAATADSEAMLAGTEYAERTYDRRPGLTNAAFAVLYREWFLANGWRVIDAPRLADPEIESAVVRVSATYAGQGRLLFAAVSAGAESYSISVADVGAEDWGAWLDARCHVPIYGIDFDFDRPTLREDSTPILDKLASTLIARKGTAVEIQGHTDNRGDDSSPPSLSEARARSVAAWLIAHGVPPGMLSTKGYGKTRPVMENDSDLGRARNRRIEVALAACTR